MKTKRTKMLRKQRRKELIAVLNRIPLKYHAEVAEKIKDLVKGTYTVEKWSELMNLLEYYAVRDKVAPVKDKPGLIVGV